MDKRIEFMKNLISSGFRRLPYPYKVNFAVTYKCNLRCKICNIWQTSLKEEELSLEETEKIFKRMKNLGWIDLTGGEITLKEEIIDTARVIIKNSGRICVFHFSTNGQLTEKTVLLAREIAKMGVAPVVNVSIDAPEDAHDKLRGVAGAYKKSIETFKELRKLKRGKYYISATLSNFNIECVDGLIAALEKDIPGFRPHELHFNIFHNSTVYYHNQDVEGLSAVRGDAAIKYLELTKGGGFIKSFLEKEYARGLRRYFHGEKIPLKCQAMNASCFINPAGEVFACNIYGQAVGYLKDYGYDLCALWNSKRGFSLRNNIDNRECPGCWTPCEAYPAILGSVLKNLISPRGILRYTARARV